MNYCAFQMLRVSCLLIVGVCFVQCFVVEKSPPTHLEHSAHFLHPIPNDLLGGGSKECAHASTIYGKRENGDLQTFVEIVNKGKSLIRKTTVEVTHPSSGKSKSNCVITQIIIENLYKGCNCNKEEFNFNSGGPGARHFNISITSDRNCPNQHKISCYAKC